MCYSTSLRIERKDLKSRLDKILELDFKLPNNYEPYFHLNGFTHGNVYIIKYDDENIYPAKWGLVPNWVQNAEEFWKKSNTLNARAETIFEKNSYRDSAEDKRCLILADGFFEPHHENGVAIPYFCYQPTKEQPKGDLFLFAGLYTELPDSGYSATILTVDANDFFAEVHNKKKRMPLILDDNYYLDWMDSGINSSEIHEIIADGFTSNKFNAHPVSRDLYKKNIETNKPYIIEEVDKATLF